MFICRVFVKYFRKNKNYADLLTNFYYSYGYMENICRIRKENNLSFFGIILNPKSKRQNNGYR